MDDKQNIVVNFTGDVSITGIFKQKVNKKEEIFSEHILNDFTDADHNVINLEGPATDSDSFMRNNGLVVSPLQSINYLFERKVGYYNLANNHLFDNGIIGFTDTTNEIKLHGGGFFGGGSNIKEAIEPIILKKKNLSVAMIGVCHKEGMISGKNKPGVLCVDNNLGLIRTKLSELKKIHNWVVLNYHGGEEYTRIPMPSRRRLLRKFATFDCDVVVAHHSHVFQGYEKYNGKYIFYSLGNFVFDIPNHKNIQYVNSSAILRCSFSQENFQFSFTPTEIHLDKGQVTTASKDFLQTIEGLSEKIVNNYYMNWLIEANRAFFKSKLPSRSKSENQARRNQPIIKILKDRQNIKRFLSLLKSPNKRPLFIAAMLYKTLLKLKFLNEES